MSGWKPQYPGEFPTLGWYAIDWLSSMLYVPDRPGVYELFSPSREQAEFLLQFYRLNPTTGRRVVRRAMLSRPRGWGKSPLVAGLCLLEALGDVYPDGWDANGRPVGQPWARIRTPNVDICATTEVQTGNTWDPLQDMVRGPILDHYPGLEPMETMIRLPYGRGSIEQITSSASSSKGRTPVFAAADQTETWFRGNGGVKMMDTLLNNLTKRAGSVVETPNAFTPGEESVAESSVNAFKAIQEGRARQNTGLFWDHREAPPETDLTDRDSLLAGLRVAYGDSSDHPDGCVLHEPPCSPGWAPLESYLARIWDPDANEELMRADLLNQITAASNAFISRPDWAACAAPGHSVPAGAAITLGFDGSRGRNKGKPDATALIACEVSTGHIFQPFGDSVWEVSERKEDWPKWEPPVTVIEAMIQRCFDHYRVVGFYADPAGNWLSHVSQWENRWGADVLVTAKSKNSPFQWWTNTNLVNVERAIEALEGAILKRDMTHDGTWRLEQHMLNARRSLVHARLTLAKESRSSARKIDAAYAAVLAWAARTDAYRAGALDPEPEPQGFVPFMVGGR